MRRSIFGRLRPDLTQPVAIGRFEFYNAGAEFGQ